jgi:hypothetical protein
MNSERRSLHTRLRNRLRQRHTDTDSDSDSDTDNDGQASRRTHSHEQTHRFTGGQERRQAKGRVRDRGGSFLTATSETRGGHS